MEDELIKIKSVSGIADSFNIENILNYIKNYKHILWSHQKINSNIDNSLNESEDCKTIICKYINKIEENNNLILNLDEKKTLFTNDVNDLNKKINNEGFCFLDKKQCNTIHNILKGLENIKYYGRSTQNKVHNEFITINQIPKYIIEKNRNIHTYFVNQHNHKNVTDLLNIEDFASLIVDPTILKAAENHLGCLPKLQTINSWISFHTRNPNELSFAAQYWHTDNDCHKFFKVFLYLNDVDETNGAHEIISNSKKTISNILKTRDLSRGELILEKNKKILSGKKGTIILEDTRNLHRGGANIEPDKYRILLHWWYGSNNDGKSNLQFFDKDKLTHNILNDYIGIII